MGENHLLQYVYLLLIRNSFYNDFVLVQSFTSTQGTTCRELQLSFSFFSLSWKGATTPYFFSFKDHFSLIFRLDPRTSLRHIINQSSESPKHQINTYTRIIYVLAPRSSPSDHINMSHYDPDPILVLIHQY